jgi:L-ascorbate metabolism protein UlaG (beta-lactamase superfamily)
MEISFLGANCVRLTGKDIALLCDPYGKAAGLPDIKSTNDATLLSVLGGAVPIKAGMVIDGPGEYEIKGVGITGLPVRQHIDAPDQPATAVAYSISIDGLRIGYLGNLAPELPAKLVEELGQCDVLILPVGGHGFTLDATSAAQIVSQLEPKYVVPTHYDDGATKYEVPQDKLEVFLKEIGSTPEPQPKLRVTNRDLPVETTVAVLSRQGS